MFVYGWSVLGLRFGFLSSISDLSFSERKTTLFYSGLKLLDNFITYIVDSFLASCRLRARLIDPSLFRLFRNKNKISKFSPDSQNNQIPR